MAAVILNRLYVFIGERRGYRLIMFSFRVTDAVLIARGIIEADVNYCSINLCRILAIVAILASYSWLWCYVTSGLGSNSQFIS